MKTINDPAQLGKMTPEQLVEAYEQTLNGIDEILAQKEAIKTELDARLQAIGEKSKEWAGYTVSRFPKIYFNNVTLETAKMFAATQMSETKEIINTAILKRLVEAGKEIPGAEVRMETRIAAVRKGEEA